MDLQAGWGLKFVIEGLPAFCFSPQFRTQLVGSQGDWWGLNSIDRRAAWWNSTSSCRGDLFSTQAISPNGWSSAVIVCQPEVIRGRVADVVGTIDPSGNVPFTAPPGANLTVDEFSIRADTTVGMKGAIHYATADLTVRGEITSAQRGPLEQTRSTIQGTWFGDSLVRFVFLLAEDRSRRQR